MNERIAALVQRMRALEDELELEFAHHRLELSFFAHNGKIRFEQRIIANHRALKTKLSRYILEARPLMLLSAPVIYAVIVPFALLDCLVTLYQAACFPVYGIPKVRRADYFVYDRRHLAYLNVLEKLNCTYCSYANGLIAYVREIASRTEQYWCPIKHARRIAAAHQRYASFVDYGDAENYRRELTDLRKRLRASEEARPAP